MKQSRLLVNAEARSKRTKQGLYPQPTPQPLPIPMKTLRGTGNTFSTSGKPWHPFAINAKQGRKQARLHRMQRKGLTPATDKASLRAAATVAAATHPIRRIP